MAVAYVQGSSARSGAAAPRLKILSHFTEIGLLGGGVPRSTLEIARLMATGGHRVTVMTAPGSKLPEEWRVPDQVLPKMMSLDPVSGRFDLLSRDCLRRVDRLLEGADLLLLHGMWRPRNSQLASLARRRGVPYVMIPHGMLDDWPMGQKPLRKRLYHLLLERRNLDSAACVVATSEAERLQASRWVPHDRISVAPLPISPVLARLAGEPGPASDQEAADELTVLFLSRLDPKKGADVLIEAVGLMKRRGIFCRLLIAGSGPSQYVRELERLVEREGIADRTRFLGWVDGPQKLSLYRVADLFSLPTSQENFGRVLVEALACRTPVITTRQAGLWQRICDAGGGLLADRTPEAFATAITDLLADRPRRERMGEAGRNWVMAWLDDGELIGRYESMFRRAVGNGAV
ncbi:MAG: glycosyltransferase [Thermoanaerobaculia bacterium]